MHRHAHRGEHHVRTMAETAVRCPHAKEHHRGRQPPEAGREDGIDAPSNPPDGTNSVTPGFLAFSLQTVRE